MSLKYEDLRGTVLPTVSIDEFEPKAGDNLEVIVVAFYLTDQEPAEDLNTFIQRGFVDTLDVEVSPNTDQDGNYLVFVEFNRDDTFPNKFQALLKDVTNVTGPLDWKVKTYFTDGVEYDYNDPELYNYVIINPEDYVSKEDFEVEELEENVKQFFGDSCVSNLTVQGSAITLSAGHNKIVAEAVDAGSYDTVIGRNFLSESAFGVGRVPHEARVLQSMLGNCQVLPLGDYLCVNRDDQVVLLKNVELNYGR